MDDALRRRLRRAGTEDNGEDGRQIVGADAAEDGRRQVSVLGMSQQQRCESRVGTLIAPSAERESQLQTDLSVTVRRERQEGRT